MTVTGHRDTPSPDTSNLDASSPDTAIPETAIPDALSPDTSVPDRRAPGEGRGGYEDLTSLLVSSGKVAPDPLRLAVEAASHDRICPAEAVVRAGIVAEDALADMLAAAVGTVVVDVEKGELDGASVGLVPATICRRYLVLPIAAGSEAHTLKVALADPLDSAAVEAVRAETGLHVEPLVATVSGVQSAIERFHGGGRDGAAPATDPASSEVAPVGVDAMLTAPATTPKFRPSASASQAQQHQALLLALIDRGILTRADYERCLARLMDAGTD